MRDDQVYHLSKENDKKVMALDNKIAAIYRQMQFLNSRIQAYEKVFSDRWQILRALFHPAWLKAQVDIEQMELLKKHDEGIKAAAEKLKEEQHKPTLVKV